MSINVLPQSTVRLITTSQIITSVSTAVKELMENAIDAKANCIQISLMNHGLDLIEVKDDGSGIPAEDVPLICQAATTSKISDITDLDSLSSYGFRGEALNALCQIGELSVTTKTSSDTLATMFKMNHEGEVISTQPSHFPNGTTVSVKNLFNNLPVRKQYLSSKGRMSEELRKVERVIKSLALIHCKLRVIFSHNRCMIWQKNQVWNLRLSLSQVIPLSIVNNMEEIQYTSTVHGTQISLIIPKKTVTEVGALCMSNLQQACFLFVNKRPVRISKIEKMLNKEFSECFRSLIPHKKYLVCLLSIEIPSNAVDVNLEPNKTKVLLRDVDELIDCIRSKISEYYYDAAAQMMPTKVSPIKPKDSNQNDKIKSGVKRKQPDSLNEELVVRKVCKSIDMNRSEDNMKPFGEQVRNDGGFMETTLSQLPFLGRKENLSEPNSSLGSASYCDDSVLNGSDLIDKVENNLYHTLDDTIGTDSPSLLVLNDVNNILTSHSISEPSTTGVGQLEHYDSAYNSAESALESHFIDTHGKDIKNDITATQRSKGNVIIDSKQLEEPVLVYKQGSETHSIQDYIISETHRIQDYKSSEELKIQDYKSSEIHRIQDYKNSEEPRIQDDKSSEIHCKQDYKSSETHSLRDYLVKMESHKETAFLEQSESINSPVEEESLNLSTAYFHSAAEELSNSSEGTTKSEELDNLASFQSEIRKNILENKAGSFCQVASQLVAKSTSVAESSSSCFGKEKSNKLKKSSAANKSMLEFVCKKPKRSYPCDTKVRFNINDVKLKLLEKSSNLKSEIEHNLSSEDSDEDSLGVKAMNVSNILDSGIDVSYGDLNIKWNQVMNIIGDRSPEENAEDTDNHNASSFDNLLNGPKDNNCINNILLKKYSFRIIGTSDKCWFFTYRKSLGVINTDNLYKLVTFHKHLRTYQVPGVDLEDCTLLDKHFLHTVITLDLQVKQVQTPDPNLTLVRVIDKLCLMNGVELLLRKNHSRCEFSALLTQAPLSSFGSKDVAELIKLVTLNKSVEYCRPAKVQRLIRTVSEEYLTKHPLSHREETISELMAYWFEHIRNSKCPLLYPHKVLFELYGFPQMM